MKYFFILATLSLSSCHMNYYEQKTPRSWMPMEVHAVPSGREHANCYSVNACALLVKTIIENNWSVPESCKGQVTRLMVKLNNQYELVGLEAIELSGNYSFDLSAAQAVKRSAPFKELAGLRNDVFQQKFQNFEFKFNPLEEENCR
jgi:hypothetical protein